MAATVSFMQNFLVSFVLLALLGSYKPGEPVATLKCKSVSGRTTFVAELPRCSYLDTAELSIDGVKLSFYTNDQSHIIFDPENQVLTISLESRSTDHTKFKFLKFWAIPSTFKKTKAIKGSGSEFHDTYEFHAKLFATDPRDSKEPNTKTIELICNLDYEL